MWLGWRWGMADAPHPEGDGLDHGTRRKLLALGLWPKGVPVPDD